MSEASKGVATNKDPSFFDVEYANVLTQYLSLFNEDSRQFNLFIAPNGMLDWFGRVQVGPQKIHNFLRLVVCTECEHLNFNKAEKCDPIERKPSHERTKLIPNDDSDYTSSLNRVNGVSSLKLYADSDIEEEDVSMVPLPEDNQIPIINKDLTKISNAYETPDTDDDSDTEMESKAKRMKRSHSPFYYLRRWSLSKDRPAITEDDSSISSSDAEMSDASATEKEKPLYTVLHYFESSGILRKHRNSLGHEDRRVRIRISYRTRIPSQDLQIALIMYEDLDRTMTLIRRKLTFDWVQETAPQEESRVESLVNDDYDSNDDVEGEQPHHSRSMNINEFDDEVTSMVAEEQPALIRNSAEEMVAATVETPTTEEIAAALESAAFTIVPFSTPTKLMRTPPSTPKRQPRVRHTAPNMKRSLLSSDLASTSSASTKRGAARCLRL